METAIILQARMNSTRRPYKISSLYNGKPLLYWQIKRLKQNRCVDNIIVATTNTDLDDVTEFIAKQAGAQIFRGELDDVMKRYIDAAEYYKVSNIIRVCGDDPLVDPECIEELSQRIELDNNNIITASHNKGWLLGTSAEAFSLKNLKKSYQISSTVEKEHVVLNFYKNMDKFNVIKIEPKSFYQELSFTVDYPEDVENVKDILNYFNGIGFSQKQLIDELKNNKIKLSYFRQDKYNI
ncbi:cytidylyltransferase domain-containing protein [Aliarcobacter butzleri]|uniref:cytidylyltransferase domain-containing protein n=1 Tax=Aliarcobacter butzleri TaxID=28197 RepID=UPI0021B3BC4E|nr:NTP transferase domain-containing protein [Aliarcobacter butzleri]MCT7639247.1 NTP transferase domain-containing protein [Aliarcobacter butzleri]